jgi:hypothetical protein
VPFFPPSAFLQMDRQTMEQKATYDLPFLPVIAHDAPGSPGSSLIGCAIQTCPEATEAANPITYVNGREPPIHVFHGTFDPSTARRWPVDAGGSRVRPGSIRRSPHDRAVAIERTGRSVTVDPRPMILTAPPQQADQRHVVGVVHPDIVACAESIIPADG